MELDCVTNVIISKATAMHTIRFYPRLSVSSKVFERCKFYSFILHFLPAPQPAEVLWQNL